MRRDNKDRGLFQYRGQWIGQEKGRDGFYRYWYDDGSRRVKRKALSAVSLEEAKEELIELLGADIPSSKDPHEVWLFDVLKHYQDHYAEPKGYKQMAAARRASELVYAAFKSFMGAPKVADLTRTNQRRVWKHMASEAGLSAKSIMTYMIAVRAAVNYSALPQLITIDEQEVEVKLLDSTVPVFCNQEEIAEHIGGQVSTPREYIPTYDELGRWIDAIEEEDDFRFVMIMLNTCARNEAIFDLMISKQVNFEVGTIDLNPVGRRQTKKRRPIIRMTTNLAAWFKHWGDDKPIRQYQDTVEKRLNKLGKPVLDEEGNVVSLGLGMPEMTCYTLRHFMATNMRRTSKPVSKEQRSKWLGHTVNEGSKTTDWYEKFDPDYLEEPMRATEEIILRLQKHTHRNLLAPTVHPQGKLRVIDGNQKAK
ncbi:hypothetical protein GOL95_10120 [Sinorhizobium medicae]|nr:hypothetical protein [Sinorhizobium medicae]